MKQKKGLMYDVIYNKLKEDSVMGEINLKEINWILGSCFHVPKELRKGIVKELTNAGLIRWKNGWNVYSIMGAVKNYDVPTKK